MHPPPEAVKGYMHPPLVALTTMQIHNMIHPPSVALFTHFIHLPLVALITRTFYVSAIKPLTIRRSPINLLSLPILNQADGYILHDGLVPQYHLAAAAANKLVHTCLLEHLLIR